MATFPNFKPKTDLNGASHPQALQVQQLTAGYAGMKHAIKDVTFDMRIGERIAVIGPNGAGKSTLFKALVGMIPHSQGEISLHGEDCRTSHNMIGYVPQHGDIDWNFPVTVRDVVMMGRTRQIGWLRWPGKRDRQQVEAALAQVGMTAYGDRQIGQLSGGQKRRVFIARALAQETDVLLLDEPFSGVDVTAEEEIMGTLDQLKTQRISVLLATHDMHMAAKRFDRLLLLNRHVVAFDEPSRVFQPDLLRQAYGRRAGVVTAGDEMIIITDR
jgi:manganese/iron transport system ATP-binding protein